MIADLAMPAAGRLERERISCVGNLHHKGKSMPHALAIFHGPQNLSAKERAISVILGLGLAAAGAKPRPNPILNIAALLGGAYLAVRGSTGRCPIKQALLSGPAEVAPATVRTPAKRSRAAGR
jgi:hypothetical protein